jgi:ABC-type maltose transport system permease subunit
MVKLAYQHHHAGGVRPEFLIVQFQCATLLCVGYYLLLEKADKLKKLGLLIVTYVCSEIENIAGDMIGV